MRALAVIGCVVACYRTPTRDPSCSIACTDSCPDGMTCDHNVCITPGESCAPTFERVFASPTFACALDAHGARWCWGSNLHAQIDASGRDSIPLATRVGTDRWDELSLGGGHACGLRAGTLYCWGRNDRSQVDGNIIGDVAAPTPIRTSPPVATWSAVAAGTSYTCAIGDGALYCWGAGDSGELGGTATADAIVPTQVLPTITDWTAVAAGWGHTCAISASAGLTCWGRDYYGDIGAGAPTQAYPYTRGPTAVALPEPVAEVTVGLEHTCAITTGGHLYCWGYAYDAELGDPQVVPNNTPPYYYATPQLATNLDGWTHVHAAEYHTCALRGDEVWCWGYDRIGAFGDGLWSESNFWQRIATGAADLAVAFDRDAQRIDSVDSYDLELTCAVIAGGVQCTGDNRFGQLGLGASTAAAAPTAVAGAMTWQKLLAGADHACGVASDGALYCWGAETSGQATGVQIGVTTPCGTASAPCDTPVPSTIANLAGADQIALGASHTCARSGATITCWGDNSYYELGTAEAGPTPRAVPSTWTALLDGGGLGACGVASGSASCWGAVVTTASLPTATPALDNIAQLGMYGAPAYGGHMFGCLLDASNELHCFGDNTRGNFGNGPSGCGDGICNGTETTATCPSDCPATPRLPCGNGACDSGETCTSCPSDCGACPLSALRRSYRSISVGWGDPLRGKSFTCGVRMDGQVECWGFQSLGECAQVDQGGQPSYAAYTPNVIAGLSACTAVAAGDLFACALCGGHVSCWGDNRFGAVGARPTDAPVINANQVGDPPDGGTWVEVVAGAGFACARADSGRAYCWGVAAHGALGTGVTSSPILQAVQLQP